MGAGSTLSIAVDDVVRRRRQHLARAAGDRPAADDAERVRLGQQVAGPARAAAAPPSEGAARSSPATPDGARRRPRPAGRSASMLQQQPPVQRGGRGEQRIRKRRIGFAVGAAAADQTRPAGQLQPRRRQQVPVAAGPEIRRTGRLPPSAPSNGPDAVVRCRVRASLQRSAPPPPTPRGSGRAGPRRCR